METKLFADNPYATNLTGLSLLATAGNGDDNVVSIPTLISYIKENVFNPYLADRVGRIILDYNSQHNGVKTYQDTYLKYILCDGTRNTYNVADYPLLAGKIPTENGGFLIIPNALDRTIRQVLSTETVGMLQEEDVKNHSHSMSHDHDMSHQHNADVSANNSISNSGGSLTYTGVITLSTTASRSRTGGSSTANTGAAGSTTRMKNLGVNMYLVAGLV
ncbi:MAG: hypothetical protein LBQ34_02940 [Alphaproteobacteria bacterium]|jgi:hypothetical protein|nr:hypothetical protein [Alphaproteobacteria bacterium]